MAGCGRTVLLLGALVNILGGCGNAMMSSRSIDPRADEALRKMSTLLANAQALSVKAVAISQEPAETGQMVQLHQQNKVILCRPDRLYVENRLGEENWGLWHKGTNLTITNMAAYATGEVPGPVDKMVDHLEAQYGLLLPLADFLYPDPYKALTANVVTGSYLGEHEVDGVKCAHLLFTQDDIDWQIWIEQGPMPVPRKLVIDYKETPGRPQYSAVLSEWDFSPKVNDEVFEPRLPHHVKKVDMADLMGLREGK